MNKINVEKLNADAKRLFEAAKSKGFYDQYPTPESRKESVFIDQKLNLIVTEIAEAYESYRISKIDADEKSLAELWDNREELIKEGKFSETYNKSVKGTVAEELADVYIRVCDLAGATDSELKSTSNKGISFLNKESLFRSITFVTIQYTTFSDGLGGQLSYVIMLTEMLAKEFGIDLEKHIELKACRNREREYMHGKNF